MREVLLPEARMGSTYQKVAYSGAELGVYLFCLTWRQRSPMVRLAALERFQSFGEKYSQVVGKGKRNPSRFLMNRFHRGPQSGSSFCSRKRKQQ